MTLSLYQVDAFAQQVFTGNPAAVCPLSAWLADEVLQAIAEENNLSETAFMVAEGNGYRLRWFTPTAEVDLCGHATLAAAHVLYKHLGYTQAEIEFYTRSGTLIVTQGADGMTMDFPAAQSQVIPTPSAIVSALGVTPLQVLENFDYVVVLENEQQVRDLQPDFLQLRQLPLRGVVVTAPGNTVDFVSRGFYPKLGINEDPVTGSAHCETVPYWAERLGKTRLHARQISRRSGDILCELRGNRVLMTGRAVTYLRGEMSLPPA